MAYLGDYLGQLLAEIIIARAQADLETVRVAELYASRPILKHFPIPHLRLPTITLDLPYVAEDIEKKVEGGSPRGKIDLGTMQNTFITMVKNEAPDYNINISSGTEKKILQELKKFIKGAMLPDDISIAVGFLSEGMLNTTVNVLRSEMNNPSEKDLKNLTDFSNVFKEKLFNAFLSIRKSPPRLDVLVTKQQLLEVKNPELLSRIHLTISEEGREWTIIEIEGKPKDRL